MAINEAPDVRAGSGIRRLNRRPLMIVGAAAIMVGGIVVYTMNERATENEVQRKSEAKKVEPVSLDSLFVNAPDAGLIAATIAPATAPEAAEAPDLEPTPTDRASGPATAAPTADDQYARDWEMYRQQVNQVQQARLQAAMTALTAAAAVPSSRSGEGGDGNATASTSGQPGDGAAGLREGLTAMLGKLQGGQGGQGGAGSVGASGDDANNAEGKAGWLRSATSSEHYLKHGREAAISAYEVKAGSIIPGVMVGGINSDLPGQIIGQVRENVYDTATGQTLLIPQGSRLIGTYDNQVTRGQSRVLVAWNRIIYPDTSSIDLDVMPGVDQAGYAGFKDKVNKHYVRVFGDSLLMSLFAAGIQLSQPQSSSQTGGYDSQQIIAGSLGQQLGQTGQQLAQQNMRIQPTLEIRPGYRFNVMVTKDMLIEPWAVRQ